MLTLMNITTTTEIQYQRYASAEDLNGFLREHMLDGLEVLPYGGQDLGVIPDQSVIGLHLTYDPYWVDFWTMDEPQLVREFGALGAAFEHYSAVFQPDHPEEYRLCARQAIIQKFAAQLDFAHRLNVRYVVFHVSDVSIEESVTYRFHHTDEQVIEATCELVNELLKGKPYHFEFLVENLWWPGFTMTRPDITHALLQGIGYAYVGIMLDLGHLMHTNRAIQTQQDGISYIHQMLDAHGELCTHIRGVHLHQSTSGAFVTAMIAQPPELQGGYFDRLGQVYGCILKIDEHRPFTAQGIGELIRRIAPKYLTYEFITVDREQHDSFIRQQNAALHAPSNR